MPTAAHKKSDPTGLNPRGSKPGVARGPYKVRRTEPDSLLSGLPDHWMEADKYDTKEIASKVCRRCKCEMELVHFSSNATGHGGVKSTCKACCAEAAIEYASTPRGRAARARAQAKFRAMEKAQEAAVLAREKWIAQMKLTPAGRTLLAHFGQPKAGLPLSPAKFFCGPMKSAISAGNGQEQKS